MRNQLPLEIPVRIVTFHSQSAIWANLVAVTTLTFETGSEKYKDLENGVFVSAGRFVVEKDKPVMVDYRVSRVTHN
jgi:Protein of unknown function (DUF3237)